MKLLHKLLATLLRRNLSFTPSSVIVDQMNESRPLPTGVDEFEDWSDRIISGSVLTATPASQKFALATMLMHLGPTESSKPDAYFIHCLRKSAVNEVAHAMMQKIRDAEKKRLADIEATEKAKAVESEYAKNTSYKLKLVDEATSPGESDVVLEDKEV